MKVSAFVSVTFLTSTLASASIVNAAGACTSSRCDLPRTGTAFEVAQQYSNGGKFGGVTSGRTGTTLEVARDSLDFLGSPDGVASTFSMPPIMAQGD